MSGAHVVVVRRASSDDAEAIARIYVESWNAGFQTLMPPRELTSGLIARWRTDLDGPPSHRWFVADVDGRAAGFAGIRPSRDPDDPTLGELDTIAVDPSRWRAGVGRELMAVALAQLSDDGYREAVLWTLDGYERGRSFYLTTGWTLDGGTRDDGRQVRYRHGLDR